MVTCHGSREARRMACLAVVVAACVGCLRGSPAGARSLGPSELAVAVDERPGIVRIHVLLPDDVPAATIEVEIVGHDLVVTGRDLGGTVVRSRPVRLSQRMGGRDAQADYEADGSLTITLHAAGADGP